MSPLIRILEDMLAMIGSGNYPRIEERQDELRAVLFRLQANSPDAEEQAELTAMFKDDSDLRAEAILVLADETMQFVASEVEKYARIKAERPFTEEEERYGREVLQPLMNDAWDLLFPGKKRPV